MYALEANCEYMAGALANRKGILMNWYWPKGVAKAVFYRSACQMGMAWKAPVPLRAVKTLLPESLDRLLLGGGKLVLFWLPHSTSVVYNPPNLPSGLLWDGDQW